MSILDSGNAGVSRHKVEARFAFGVRQPTMDDLSRRRMHPLVTGRRGHVATTQASMLMRAGHDVFGDDSDLFGGYGLGDEAVPELVEVKDPREKLNSDLVGLDAALYLAELSNDPLGDLDPELSYRVNTNATLRLAELERLAGVEPLLFSTSWSNYGSAGDEGFKEKFPLRPATPCARLRRNGCSRGGSSDSSSPAPCLLMSRR